MDDERISIVAYGLRNPWSCFPQESNLILLDVGNSHWEEVNIIKDFNNVTEPVFLGGLGLKAILMQTIKTLQLPMK